VNQHRVLIARTPERQKIGDSKQISSSAGALQENRGCEKILFERQLLAIKNAMLIHQQPNHRGNLPNRMNLMCRKLPGFSARWT